MLYFKIGVDTKGVTDTFIAKQTVSFNFLVIKSGCGMFMYVHFAVFL